MTEIKDVLTDLRAEKPTGEAVWLQRAGSATPEIYVFERSEGWYPLELKDDAEACKNAECNPGTVKVTTKSGRPVWPNPS